ncbi:MAG: branched-chain amino acid ABC transporter permease [Deltaproteobacteria bacterium]|nr:branched-chain amino acid ABC transporter permease [Deltaproteobacteria bacterium]
MFLQQLINGIAQGSLFALIAISFSLVWGLLRMVNFAMGELYMLGAYAGWLVVMHVTPNLGVALFAGFMVGWIVGWLIEKVAFKAMRGVPHIASLVCTIGFSFFLKETASTLFGAETKSMPSYYSQTAFTIAEANISWLQVLMVAVAIIMMVLLQLLFYRTKVGLAVRAVALDYRTASLMGMKVDRVTSLAFSLSGALVGFVGVLAAIYYNAVNAGMGFVPAIKGFTAAVFGGITSIPGAILGGYLLGAIENLSVKFMSSGYRDFVSFLILIIFLLFRPNGILGKKTKL